jgi:hypothetical protein
MAKGRPLYPQYSPSSRQFEMAAWHQEFAERTLWYVEAGSVLLEASKLHHLGPLLSFVGDELGKVRDRAKKRLAAEIRHPCLHRGIGQRQIDLLIEPLDDLGRRALGSADAQSLQILERSRRSEECQAALADAQTPLLRAPVARRTGFAATMTQRRRI